MAFSTRTQFGFHQTLEGDKLVCSSFSFVFVCRDLSLLKLDLGLRVSGLLIHIFCVLMRRVRESLFNLSRFLVLIPLIKPVSCLQNKLRSWQVPRLKNLSLLVKIYHKWEMGNSHGVSMREYLVISSVGNIS